MLGQLTENATGQPDQVLCGGFRVAVIGQLRGLVLELALASAGVGQRRLGPRRSQVGELADGAAQAPQHRGVIPPERGHILARAVGARDMGQARDIGQRPGDGAGPRGQLLERVEHRAVGPRHTPSGHGPRVPPQALPRVPGRRAGPLRRLAELPVVPWPGLNVETGIRIGGRAAEILQRAGDALPPLPDRVLGRPQLQRREHQDVDGEPGGHADADVDHPVRDVVERLIAAEEQDEQSREGDLGALISQPPPAADQDPADDNDRDRRHPRSQQQAGRDGKRRADTEAGHVPDALVQGAGHRRVDAEQRRQRREVRTGLADRVPGQRPRPHRGDRPLEGQPDLVLPVPHRSRRGGTQRHREPRGPHAFQGFLRAPDRAASQHPALLPRKSA